MKMLRARQRPRGTILLVAMLLLTLLSTLGMGMLSSSLNENVVSLNDVNSQRAMGVAEGGLAHARKVIAANLSTTTLTSRLSGATTSVPEVALSAFSNVASFGTGNGTYSVWVSNNLTAYNKTPGYAADSGGVASDVDNRIWIKSVGTYKNATRTVRAFLDFSTNQVLTPPGAVTLIDGTNPTELSADFIGNAFGINGNDSADPTASGACGSPGPAKPGISLNSSDSLGVTGSALGKNQQNNVVGLGGTPSLANNGNISAATLQAAATAMIPAATSIPGGSNSNSYGCPVATSGPPACDGPGVYVANSDVKLDGDGRGFGILIVTADFEMAGNYHWEGLIIVVGQGSARITGADSKLYGAMLVANTRGGTTNLELAGNGGAFYSSQAICRIQNLVPSSSTIAWQQVG